jgi:hypothetical protein
MTARQGKAVGNMALMVSGAESAAGARKRASTRSRYATAPAGGSSGDLDRRGFTRLHEPGIGQRELARPSGRSVVPGNPHQGFADFGIADLDRRPEPGAVVGHRDEPALDAPGPTPGYADDELRTVRAERSTRRRPALRRSAVGAHGESEHAHRNRYHEQGGHRR